MPDATGVKTQDELIEELAAAVIELTERIVALEAAAEKTNKAKTAKEKVVK